MVFANNNFIVLFGTLVIFSVSRAEEYTESFWLQPNVQDQIIVSGVGFTKRKLSLLSVVVAFS
jgi:hypothetical protein